MQVYLNIFVIPNLNTHVAKKSTTTGTLLLMTLALKSSVLCIFTMSHFAAVIEKFLKTNGLFPAANEFRTTKLAIFFTSILKTANAICKTN